MTYKISELATIKRGSSPRPINDFIVSDGLPWLKISDFRMYDKYVYETKEFIKESGLKNTRYVKAGTLVVTNSATPGIPIFLGNDMCLHDGFLYFENVSEKVDLEYLYYLLLAKRNDLVRLGNGSIFVNLKKEILENFEIDLPDINVQRHIAKCLSRLDEKIKINKKINDNIFEQIKTIYKNMIKNCQKVEAKKVADLPLYVTDYVANGSFASLKENVKLLDKPDYAYFIRNTDLKSNDFNVFVDKHSYEFLSKSKLEGKEIIVSNVGDIGSVFLCPKLDKPMTLGNNVIMIKPIVEEYRYYLFCWLSFFDGQRKMQGIKGGSAVPKFNKTEFKSLSIDVPDSNTLISFNKLVTPLFELIINNNDENKRISIIRESLIPKVFSGEFDMSNIKIED